MILFVVTPEFRRRFRPPRPSDPIPMRPMLDVLLLWICMTLGGVCGSVGVVSFIGAQVEGMVFDRPTLGVIIAMSVAAPVFFWGTFVMWKRLNQ